MGTDRRRERERERVKGEGGRDRLRRLSRAICREGKFPLQPGKFIYVPIGQGGDFVESLGAPVQVRGPIDTIALLKRNLRRRGRRSWSWQWECQSTAVGDDTMGRFVRNSEVIVIDRFKPTTMAQEPCPPFRSGRRRRSSTHRRGKVASAEAVRRSPLAG